MVVKIKYIKENNLILGEKMLRNNKGQGMVEYILIIVLVVIVVIAGVKMFGGKVNNMFQDSTQKISTEANVK